jgi:hypothetical protein
VLTRDHEDDSGFLSHILSHLFCIRDTLFNVYGPPIETSLSTNGSG